MSAGEQAEQVEPQDKEEAAIQARAGQHRRGGCGSGAAIASSVAALVPSGGGRHRRAGIGLVRVQQARPGERRLKTPLRKVLNFNDSVAKTVFFSDSHLAREFPRSFAREPENNYKGATPTIDQAAWRLHLHNPASGGPLLKLTMKDIKELPEVDQTTELNCIEGWTVIVNWTGVRFADFVEEVPATPKERSSSRWSRSRRLRGRVVLRRHRSTLRALHPQTLLAYQINGKPLGEAHGAPLRLVIPTKYGIKNIKLITGIAYAEARAPPTTGSSRGMTTTQGSVRPRILHRNQEKEMSTSMRAITNRGAGILAVVAGVCAAAFAAHFGKRAAESDARRLRAGFRRRQSCRIDPKTDHTSLTPTTRIPTQNGARC